MFHFALRAKFLLLSFALLVLNPVVAQPVDHATEALRHPEAIATNANILDFDAILSEAEEITLFGLNKVKKKGKKLEAIVNLSTQRMTVLVDGQRIHKWWISSGKLGDETPTGTYKPTRMYRKYRSKTYNNARMPNAVFFHHGYAIHGSFAYHTMGRRASHGCIRLTLAHGRKFYNLVQAHGKSNTTIRIKR